MTTYYSAKRAAGDVNLRISNKTVGPRHDPYMVELWSLDVGQNTFDITFGVFGGGSVELNDQLIIEELSDDVFTKKLNDSVKLVTGFTPDEWRRALEKRAERCSGCGRKMLKEVSGYYGESFVVCDNPECNNGCTGYSSFDESAVI